MRENGYINLNHEPENDKNLEYAKWQQTRDAERQEMLERKAAFFGKWMWILFLMFIPDIILEVMTFDFVTEIFPWISKAENWFDPACAIASGLIMIKMSEKEFQYQLAGIFLIIANVIHTSINVFEISNGWSNFILLPSLAFGLMAKYNELMAHASAICGIDDRMSKKWRALWTWFLRIILCSFGSIVLMLIVPLVGFIAFTVTLIGVLIVEIAKVVYLYRSAKICLGYSAR